MMNLVYDLHTHSCLSPCGDDNMAPANIADMVAPKGLDVVTLIDHNIYHNCPAFMAVVAGYGVLAVPSMKINTSEEVHAMCLSPTLEKAFGLDIYVYGKLTKFPSRERIFRKQQICDDRDRVCASEPSLLINATEVSFDSLQNLVRSYDGVMLPAHVDKAANSLTVDLDSIPPDSCFKTMEVRDLKKLHRLKHDNPHLEQCRIISNLDIHHLEHIDEVNPTMQVEERSTGAVVRALLQEWRFLAVAVLQGSRYLSGAVPWQRRIIEDSDDRLEMYRKIELEPFCHMCYS